MIGLEVSVFGSCSGGVLTHPTSNQCIFLFGKKVFAVMTSVPLSGSYVADPILII